MLRFAEVIRADAFASAGASVNPGIADSVGSSSGPSWHRAPVDGGAALRH
ncbi:MAG TPA: hypothetical protein VER12_07105 [Polyangiaceae bacterium]|nr:hypothetical protein [Polyangiaceae bacterium]